MHSISGDMEQDEILNLNETGFLKPKSKKNPYFIGIELKHPIPK